MNDKTDITRLYREFEEALTDFVAASLSVDDDPTVVLPRRARLAKARERLCSQGPPGYTRLLQANIVAPGALSAVRGIAQFGAERM